MNFHSFRNSLLSAAFALAASLLLVSCGGGGATGNPNVGGPIGIVPADATFYAGVPSTMTVSGGRPPYAITSSEPGILPVPAILNGNSFEVIPNNPGVVDVGLQDGQLPVRTVTVFARDTTGILVSAVIKVAQNFLTGYGLILSPTTCPTGTGTTPPTACAGGQTGMRMNATFNGSLRGNQQFRIEVIRGNFSLRDPVTGALSQSFTTNSDHTGTITGIIEVAAGTPTQIAVVRVIHIPTGVYADQVFTISGTSATAGLTLIPNTFTFTGATTADCGTGTADFFVFDGLPPYRAESSNPNIIVLPIEPDSQPGRFRILATNPSVCITNGTIVVIDSRGGRATATVTTEAGSAAPPAPVPVTVSPATLTLACGSSGSVSVIGGSGPLSVTSTHPRVTAIRSGNTIQISRAALDVGGPFPTTATVSVTDGNTVATVAVTVPATCP